MADSLTDSGALYSPQVGILYVFNLIVGTGALTMPKAFSGAGWLLSLILITLLCATSCLTVTFVVEAMASANALRRIRQRMEEYKKGLCVEHNNEHDESADENSALLHHQAAIDKYSGGDVVMNQSVESLSDVADGQLFDITDRMEMGTMASLFFNKVGVNLLYLCICIYLYGDLAIYAAAVPKSMRDVACTYNVSYGNHTPDNSDQCWPGVNITRFNAYRIFLIVFTLLLGPFVFFNVQKTFVLQVITIITRWIAFGLMITLAVIRLSAGKGEGHPPVADISGVPTLFGVCVYSFMCHHSLPSLITPIRNKSKLSMLFGLDYMFILGFYSLLSFTAIFTFSDLQDVYTLNFKPLDPNDDDAITNIKVFQYFLALFPVFVLSTNYPIIAVTLRNNLKTIPIFRFSDRPYPWAVDRLVFPIAAIIPPLIIAMATDNVEVLVGITGSYAGAGVQYVIPVALVFCARRAVSTEIGGATKHKHSSPFTHWIWLLCIIIWTVICISVVTVNNFQALL